MCYMCAVLKCVCNVMWHKKILLDLPCLFTSACVGAVCPADSGEAEENHREGSLWNKVALQGNQSAGPGESH